MDGEDDFGVLRILLVQLAQFGDVLTEGAAVGQVIGLKSPSPPFTKGGTFSAQCSSGLGGSLLSSAFGFFWSPRTVLSGQTLNIGHFSQPTAKATGHRVMGLSSSS